MARAELGQSLSDFGKAVKLLGDCEGNALGKAFSELGAKSETLSVKLQKDVSFLLFILDLKWLFVYAWSHDCIVDENYKTVTCFFGQQAYQILMNFEEPLKDYVRAVQSIKVSLVCFSFI